MAGGGLNSVELLEKLVGFATVSRDSNLELIEHVRTLLIERGIEVRLYYDATRTKANLYASIGPTEASGVLLSGHTDVVPVDGQRWTSEPFRVSERAGRLYGRGTADMKGFIACALRACDLASRRQLRLPLHLALSYDEEVGCLGVRSLIDDMAGWAHRPRLAIVGEPTSLRVAIGHKGKTALRARCTGRPAHSANPGRGVNAIHLACDLVAAVREQQAEIAAEGASDSAYEVPHTTLHVGVIQGGTVLNIVPARCELELEIRNVPDDDASAIVAALREAAARIIRDTGSLESVGIELEPLHDYPALDTRLDAEVVRLVAALSGEPELIKVSFGSEAGLFSERLGIATVVCGPGSIEQAHRPDEFIERAQLERCDAMLDALLTHLS